MAQYDVFALDKSEDLFLELQAGNLQELPTRIGAPLILKTPFHKPVNRLHVELPVGGRTYIMLTHHLFSVPDLWQKIGNVAGEEYKISTALDMLFYGF
jgi:hypothetical protein